MTQLHRRQLILGTAASVAAGFVHAQDSAYPNKPIRWIVTFPAGGGADWITHAITDRLRNHLGQPVLVDNRPGGASTIGLSLLAKSPPDGYTVASGELGALTMTPHLMRSIPYDPLKDLQPVSMMCKNSWLWVINPNKIPVTSFADFLTLARAAPGKFSYASFGPGSITHVMTELLTQRTGTKLLHVPYKGAAPAHQDLLAGQVDAMFTDYSNWKAFAGTGRMRAVACSSSTRLAQLPDLPTMEESGVPRYDISSWLGALVPAGTPGPVVERLRQAITAVVNSPDIAREFAERAFVPIANTPAQFQQVIREGLASWEPVIKSANISLE